MKKINQSLEQSSLAKDLEKLKSRLAEKEKEREEVTLELERVQAEFEVGDRIISSFKTFQQGLKNSLRAVPAYLLGRRNLKRLYSKTYKQKDAENKLKTIKKYLYDLGFEQRALEDLLHIYSTTQNGYLKRAVAWELGLYYANQLDKKTANLSIKFLEQALAGREKDKERKRKITILQAESYELLGKFKDAKQLLLNLLDEDRHPDVFLALANVEETPEKRLSWINETLRYFGLQEISLIPDSTGIIDAYYRLTTKQSQEKLVNIGPKVSVIIPAYNAENGIQVALDSLLNQTWQNLELIVVDDCSTDGTREVVQRYMEKDDRVKLLSTPENSGPYVARNIGLQQATGEFVTINDADDWSHPEKIQKQTEHLLNNSSVVANTSNHARLTESLKPYRRGMPGQYIFSNMSSLMFRREPVLEKIGYWDQVRFAADSEFKNRMIHVFGQNAVVDLNSAPLSFPMQSSSSLTANSTYGYAGYLMGVRKEYRESYTYYHEQAESLFMPFPLDKRLFPVPHPMKPDRTKKARKLDVVIIADFREKITNVIQKKINTLKEMGLTIGLVQMGTYDLKLKPNVDPSIREMIDGDKVQMLVYGESIVCHLLFIYNPGIFAEQQKYIPKVSTNIVRIIITKLPSTFIGNKKVEHYNLRECARRIDEYVLVKSKWYPLNETLRKELDENHDRELRSIPLSITNWEEETKDTTAIRKLVENWFVEENPFHLR